MNFFVGPQNSLFVSYYYLIKEGDFKADGFQNVAVYQMILKKLNIEVCICNTFGNDTIVVILK